MFAIQTTRPSDYSLVGEDTRAAIERGLAEAAWYASPVPRDKMRQLLERRNGSAMRDTVLWFALIVGFGYAGFRLWQAGSWWAVIPFMIYGVLYGSTSDSRWHESSHGTAFRTDWMNNGRFDFTDGSPQRRPVCVALQTYRAREHDGKIFLGPPQPAVRPEQ